jgi:D-alanyl-D-alanine carboxypeptidase (penicillin-binding protein 5/6)
MPGGGGFGATARAAPRGEFQTGLLPVAAEGNKVMRKINRRIKTDQKKRRWPLYILIIAAVLLTVQILRPFEKPVTVLTLNPNPSIDGVLNLNWPPNSQGAICVANEGLIQETPDQSPKPTASVAKIMTAYLILKDHPLTRFQDGPPLKFTAEDERTYARDKSDGQSVVKVVAGEKLTERQMLEALLLPSANNIATALAKWDSGSLTAFVAKMNKTAQALGMNNTHYEDPAGINLGTQSSTHDQLLIAQKAMQIDIFRKIVGMAQATLPIVGTVYNVNYVLGKGGIVGIKTGSMPRVGGNFVFASYHRVGSRNLLIIGALFGVMGKKPIMDALNGALVVLQKAKESLQLMHVVKKEEQIGTVTFRPGHVLSLQSTQSIDSIVWPQKELHLNVQLKQLSLPIRKGDILGTVTLEGANPQKATIAAAQSISAPTLMERLKRWYW